MDVTDGAALAAELAALRAEVADLRQQLLSVQPQPGGHPAPCAPVRQGPVGRRQALRTGLAVAGAAVAGAVLLDGQPAAAANGSNLILGSANQSASATTAFAVTGTATVTGFGVVDNSIAADAYSTRPAILAHSKGTGGNFNTGIQVVAEQSSVGAKITAGAASGADITNSSGFYPALEVFNSSTSLTSLGVLASSNGGIAVEGSAGGNGTGVKGLVHGIGDSVLGENQGPGSGVGGYSKSGSGVYGTTETGSAGVLGNADTIGVKGTSAVIGVKGTALSSGGIGVVAESFGGTAFFTAEAKNGANIKGTNYHLRLTPATGRNAPLLDTTNHDRGEFIVDTDGQLWFCIAGGAPGVWRQLSGLGSAGSLFVMPSPKRVYDSRTGYAPTAVGPKTPLAPNVARTIDLKGNASTIPPGATAALVTILVVGAAAGNGNLTVWANGVAKPTANTMVWGGAAGGRYTAKELTATDAQSRIQVSSSLKTDVVIDVVGYYR